MIEMLLMRWNVDLVSVFDLFQSVYRSVFWCTHQTSWLVYSTSYLLYYKNVRTLFMLSASFWMVLSVSGGEHIICVIVSGFFKKLSKILSTLSSSQRAAELATMSMLFVEDAGMIC